MPLLQDSRLAANEKTFFDCHFMGICSKNHTLVQHFQLKRINYLESSFCGMKILSAFKIKRLESTDDREIFWNEFSQVAPILLMVSKNCNDFMSIGFGVEDVGQTIYLMLIQCKCTRESPFDFAPWHKSTMWNLNHMPHQ